MKEVVREYVEYEANDGRVFHTKEECVQYEERRAKELKKENEFLEKYNYLMGHCWIPSLDGIPPHTSENECYSDDVSFAWFDIKDEKSYDIFDEFFGEVEYGLICLEYWYFEMSDLFMHKKFPKHYVTYVYEFKNVLESIKDYVSKFGYETSFRKASE